MSTRRHRRPHARTPLHMFTASTAFVALALSGILATPAIAEDGLEVPADPTDTLVQELDTAVEPAFTELPPPGEPESEDPALGDEEAAEEAEDALEEAVEKAPDATVQSRSGANYTKWNIHITNYTPEIGIPSPAWSVTVPGNATDETDTNGNFSFDFLVGTSLDTPDYSQTTWSVEGYLENYGDIMGRYVKLFAGSTSCGLSLDKNTYVHDGLGGTARAPIYFRCLEAKGLPSTLKLQYNKGIAWEYHDSGVSAPILAPAAPRLGLGITTPAGVTGTLAPSGISPDNPLDSSGNVTGSVACKETKTFPINISASQEDGQPVTQNADAFNLTVTNPNPCPVLEPQHSVVAESAAGKTKYSIELLDEEWSLAAPTPGTNVDVTVPVKVSWAPTVDVTATVTPENSPGVTGVKAKLDDGQWFDCSEPTATSLVFTCEAKDIKNATTLITQMVDDQGNDVGAPVETAIDPYTDFSSIEGLWARVVSEEGANGIVANNPLGTAPEWTTICSVGAPCDPTSEVTFNTSTAVLGAGRTAGVDVDFDFTAILTGTNPVSPIINAPVIMALRSFLPANQAGEVARDERSYPKRWVSAVTPPVTPPTTPPVTPPGDTPFVPVTPPAPPAPPVAGDVTVPVPAGQPPVAGVNVVAPAPLQPGVATPVKPAKGPLNMKDSLARTGSTSSSALVMLSLGLLALAGTLARTRRKQL
ncbi:MAG: LPXTG cell wall anchor domain-containing protein [Actinomycetaceae bacterium]|nr:LPXTG cell wall anchor domain-containing protein [Actinomycetaceae bacterium]